MSNLKITAHQLAVIIDTLTHSLSVSKWDGYYTAQSRENVRNTIAQIMDKMSVEIITDKAEYTLDADTGI